MCNRTDQANQKIVQNNAPINAKLTGGITGKGFLPGKSGNPGGRPKKKPITSAYERLATRAEYDAVAKAMFSRAKRGNVKAAAEITDRIEGKLTPEAEPTGPQIKVVIVPAEMCPPSDLKRANAPRHFASRDAANIQLGAKRPKWAKLHQTTVRTPRKTGRAEQVTSKHGTRVEPASPPLRAERTSSNTRVPAVKVLMLAQRLRVHF